MAIFSFNRTPSQWRIDDVSKIADLCFPLDIHHPDVWTFTALFSNASYCLAVYNAARIANGSCLHGLIAGTVKFKLLLFGIFL